MLLLDLPGILDSGSGECACLAVKFSILLQSLKRSTLLLDLTVMLKSPTSLVTSMDLRYPPYIIGSSQMMPDFVFNNILIRSQRGNTSAFLMVVAAAHAM